MISIDVKTRTVSFYYEKIQCHCAFSSFQFNVSFMWQRKEVTWSFYFRPNDYGMSVKCNRLDEWGGIIQESCEVDVISRIVSFLKDKSKRKKCIVFKVRGEIDRFDYKIEAKVYLFDNYVYYVTDVARMMGITCDDVVDLFYTYIKQVMVDQEGIKMM